MWRCVRSNRVPGRARWCLATNKQRSNLSATLCTSKQCDVSPPPFSIMSNQRQGHHGKRDSPCRVLSDSVGRVQKEPSLLLYPCVVPTLKTVKSTAIPMRTRDAWSVAAQIVPPSSDVSYQQPTSRGERKVDTKKRNRPPCARCCLHLLPDVSSHPFVTLGRLTVTSDRKCALLLASTLYTQRELKIMPL